MRQMYFFRRSKIDHINSTGDGNTNSFDAQIQDVLNDINGLKDKLYGVPPMRSIQAEIDLALQGQRNLIVQRDQLRAGAKQKREDYNAAIASFDIIINDLRDQKTELEDSIKKLEEVALPRLVELKNAHAQESYNQTFANKGVDVVSQQKLKAAEAEAIRIAAASKAMVNKANQEVANKIATDTSKTTKTVVIIIILAVLVTTAVIIYKRKTQK